MKINEKLSRKCGTGGISSHFIGVASELKASAFFAERGYEVSFPMSSQSRFDFIATSGDQIIKVQVKTISYEKIGKYTYGKSRIGSPKDDRAEYTHVSADMFMFVGDGDLYLIPTEHIIGHTCISFGNDNENYKPHRRKGSVKINPKDFKVI